MLGSDVRFVVNVGCVGIDYRYDCSLAIDGIIVGNWGKLATDNKAVGGLS